VRDVAKQMTINNEMIPSGRTRLLIGFPLERYYIQDEWGNQSVNTGQHLSEDQVPIKVAPA